MLSFFERLELTAKSSKDNVGRIVIEKDEIKRWLEAQEEDDAVKRSSGTAHGNLFLSVARAKKSKPGDVRAVCPFSSATVPPVALVQSTPALAVTAKSSGGGCPAHAKADPEPALEVNNKGRGCPAHAHESVVAKSGVCPAHAHTKGNDVEPCS